MECRQCGVELLAGKAFCHACGTPAPASCADCGSRLAPEFRFCPDCGAEVGGSDAAPETPEPQPGRPDPIASLGGPPHPVLPEGRGRQGVVEGERKLVTVFFCDLAGSTAIAEKLDPEEYRELLEQYVALAFREVYRFEGIVNQLAGDGMMALFGAPVAREDAPVRALWAAIGIHEALARFNERLGAAGKPELHARIGIHTGPVVVGTVGDDHKMDYTAIGDTTNLAARLEALAAPGSTLVSAATYGMVRGFFEMRPAGPFVVKGKTEPVVAYEVVCRRAAVSPIALAAERGLTPLVGRELELEQLEACYQRAAAGLPQVVTVSGETGSGRSRLIYEFKRRLAPTPRVFEGRCVALNQRVPFYPWVAMLQQYLGIAEHDAPEVALRKLKRRAADLGSAVEERLDLLRHMLSLPADAVANRPEEDIERDTFEAVGHIFNVESQNAPVVVILEDLQWIDAPSLAMVERAIAKLHHARVMFVLTYRPDFATAWTSTGVLTQIRLRRLSDDDALAIIRNIAGGPLPATLETMILSKAEGSPFYAEEITRSLLENGDIVHSDQSLTRPVEDIRLPGTVQEVIAARLDTLDPEAKRVVQIAAVIGRQFRRDQIEALANGDGIVVERALAELERRGIIHRKSVFSDADYRFGESLTQEVAYEGLLLRQRRQLHARAGQLLEEAVGDWTPERSARLAYHFANSDDDARAAQAYLRAAADAEKVPAYQAATAYYRDAWELASARVEGPDATAMQRFAVDAAHGLGRMSVLYNAPGYPDVPAVLTRAAEFAESLGDIATKAALLTFSGMDTMTRSPGQFERGLAIVEEALARAELAGQSPPGIARGLAWAYLLDGRFELARRTVDRAIAQLADSKHGNTLADIYVGTLYLRDRIDLHRGRLDEAERSAMATRDLALRAGNRTVQSGSAGTLAVVHYLRGAYEEALQWAETSLEQARGLGNPFGRHGEAAIAVLAATQLGGTAARIRLPEFFESDISVDGDRATSLPLIVDALLALGDVERGRQVARRGYDGAAGRLRRMLAARSLAHALSVGGEEGWAEAESLWEEAIALAEAMGSPVDAATARIGAAELALRRGAPAPIADWLARATDACRGLRLAPAEARIAALASAPARAASG